MGGAVLPLLILHSFSRLVAAVSSWCFPTVMLQVLYKLKTAKVFDRNRSRDDKGGGEVSDEDPFAIQLMAWCPESRMLSVAGVSADVIIYRFSKLEVTTEVVQVGNAKHCLRNTQTLAQSKPARFPCQQTDLRTS